MSAAERRGPVLALRIPSDPGEAVTVTLVWPTPTALSDVVGGGLLDDDFVAPCAGGLYGVYLDEQRVTKGLRLNDRAAVLSVRLGQVDRNWLAGLRGTALVVGVDPVGNCERDVPSAVLVAACQAQIPLAVGRLMGLRKVSAQNPDLAAPLA